MASTDLQNDIREFGDFDYIIVGAGSAGCVLANRLSANPQTRVLLLEAGGKDNYIWIHIPVGYLYTMNNPRTDWCMETTAQDKLGGRALSYPRGKVLGGCSSINGMIYMRGQARDYDQWRQLGASGWSWDEVLPYFKRSEDQVRGGDEFHGEGGEWRVEEPRIQWPILDAFRSAAAELGIPPIDDFNRGNNEGCGYFQVNQRRGRRWNASQAFLKPAKDRSNLRVVTHAHAKRLVIENKIARGVEFAITGQVFRARANAEVILAAGAIASPQLMQLSGIGSGEQLRALGIDVMHDLPGVGMNLQDHLQLRLAYKVHNTTTLNELAATRLRRVGMGLQYLLSRRGPLTMAPSQLGCFAKSDQRFDTPNLQYHIQPLSTPKLGDELDPFPGITASVCNLRPLSRGTVRLSCADPFAKPLIDPCYLSDPADTIVAAEAIRLTRSIMATRAMAPYSPQEFRPGLEFQTDLELAEAAGQIGSTIFHPVGTCKMGTDANAVVDPRLQVIGIGRLRVADASVMPTITSGNTNSPTIMIAEKASDMILADADQLEAA